MINKKLIENIGDILKVDFDNGAHTYARVINLGYFAFYDFKTDKEITNLFEIIEKPILFIIVVTVNATERWEKKGNMALEEELKKLPKFFVENIGYPGTYTIRDGLISRPASKEECIGLEYAIIWTPEFVEERIRDYYAGTSNYLLERYKLKD